MSKTHAIYVTAFIFCISSALSCSSAADLNMLAKELDTDTLKAERFLLEYADLGEQSTKYNAHSLLSTLSKKKLALSTLGTLGNGYLLWSSLTSTNDVTKKLKCLQACCTVLCAVHVVDSAFEFYDQKKKAQDILEKCTKNYSAEQIAVAVAIAKLPKKPSGIQNYTILELPGADGADYQISILARSNLVSVDFIEKVQQQQQLNKLKQLQ